MYDQSRDRSRTETTTENERNREGGESRSDASSAHSSLAALHGAIGNQAVQVGHQDGTVQTSLTVSQPGDPAEREAEQVAEQVLRGRDASVLTSVNRRHGRSVDDETTGTSVALEEELASATTGGQPLPSSTREFFESRFGRSFGDVRVHTGEQATRAARAIDAEAFTLGSDIVFRRGAYAPGSQSGRRLLAHELTHVVQQRGDPAAIQRVPTSAMVGSGGGLQSTWNGETRDARTIHDGSNITIAVETEWRGPEIHQRPDDVEEWIQRVDLRRAGMAIVERVRTEIVSNRTKLKAMGRDEPVARSLVRTYYYKLDPGRDEPEKLRVAKKVFADKLPGIEMSEQSMTAKLAAWTGGPPVAGHGSFWETYGGEVIKHHVTEIAKEAGEEESDTPDVDLPSRREILEAVENMKTSQDVF